MSALLTKVRCWWGGHQWTCAAEQGIQPTDLQLARGLDGYWDYARMYCARCGVTSQLSRAQHGQSYAISIFGAWITCLICGRTSYNHNDVRERYCGHCQVFHDDFARGAGLAGESVVSSADVRPARRARVFEEEG